MDLPRRKGVGAAGLVVSVNLCVAWIQIAAKSIEQHEGVWVGVG